MASPTSSRLAGLDTLRATAIVLVMLYHLETSLPSAWTPVGDIGWIGVDLFFVLSGFLIGSQLLRSRARLDLGDFYLRRAFRILPAYLTVVALYVAWPLWREQQRLPAVWKLLTFTANLAMKYPAERAFSHVWSLCVEEHFYLVLPLLILLFARRGSATRTIALFVAILLAGIALRWYLLPHAVLPAGEDNLWPPFMKRIYYPTYSRLDGLTLGVAAATVRVLRPSWWQQLTARPNLVLLLGLLLLASSLALFQFAYPDPTSIASILFGFPLLALAFTLLTVAAASLRGALSHHIPGARWMATLAFSLYLTHKEIVHLDQHFFPSLTAHSNLGAACLYGVTCLAAAAALYFAVERPFLDLRSRLLRHAGSSRPEIASRLDPAL